MKPRHQKQIWAFLLVLCMILQPILVQMPDVQASEETSVIIDPVDYGADPTGMTDSTRAIQEAFEAAKQATEDGASSVIVDFPKGEYHIYKDYAEKREYHTSNTNSIDSPEKTIGLLIEGQKNFTLEGNGSLFMMHGNMMALAVVESENVTLHDFAWDFAVPTVSEMTIVDMGTEDGKPYTDFFIPKCCPYEITGTTLLWTSEKSPYTGEYYWTETGIHNAYSVVAYHPDEEMTRAYYTSDSPFAGAEKIEKQDDTTLRITYNSARPSMQKEGMILELASSAYRETAGAFTWESKNVTAREVDVHFMHGFGWLIQMSTDVYYYDCDLMPRENSGHQTVSFADGIHASGAAGEIVIENCNFSNTHDDPINLHGTFTRVEQRIDDHTLQLKYIHTQQGGFPQFHEGDQVAFFTRDTLESTDDETLYTVEEVISNPGENGNDLRTMEIRFAQELPENLSDRVSGEPKYVAENVTYAPEVTIRNCTFRYVPTRGILCTTRNKVLIENNTFLNMSMATIYLSNDSDEWYESGPIRDMTIRNNTFYIKSIGRTSWEYAPAVYVHPVTKGGGLPSEDNPIHKNITIEGNTFHMDVDTVVKAESVENLTIRNNNIIRTNPEVSIQLTAKKTELVPGEGLELQTEAEGDAHTRAQDNVYEFTKCKNVVLEGNTYDDGLKRYAVLSDMSENNLTNRDSDIQVVWDRNQPAADPVEELCYASTDPDVISVDAEGNVTAKKAGTASVLAYYHWNDTIIRSNEVAFTVEGDSQGQETSVKIQGEDSIQLTQEGETYSFTAQVLPQGQPEWSVEDFETGKSTDAAVIDENGVLTAKKNGIVWVKAAAGTASDRRAVVISLPEAEGVNPDFEVVREDASNYTLEKDRITVDLQAGDLWETSNTVKNLFLYEIPEEINSQNMKTVIKAENLPVRENNQWDTVSFLLYRDDDNYISIGKKSHFDGIARVEEIGGVSDEVNGNEAENQVTTAWLGFSRQGDQVSLDYKLEGGEWTHLATLSAAAIGEDYRIGFTGWETNDRGRTATFSEFRVADASLTYEEVCEQEPISFSGVPNQAPAVSDCSWDAQEYQIGQRAGLTYTYQDPDGDSEGRTLYQFSYENGEEEVTASPYTTAKREGVLTARIYPVDAHGTPGKPVETSTLVSASDTDLSMEELALNGSVLYRAGQEEKSFVVQLPEELGKVELSYCALGGEGSVEILKNSLPVEGDWGKEETLTLAVSDEDVLQVKMGADEAYTIRIQTIAGNQTGLDRIRLEELSFDQENPETGSWFLQAEPGQSQAVLRVTGKEALGGVTVLEGAGQKELELTKDGEDYTAALTFKNGMNSYYIRTVAKDQTTTTQYMIHVNYAAGTDAQVEGILMNQEELEGFDPEKKEYYYGLEPGASSLEIQVQKGAADRIKIRANGVVTEGEKAVCTDLKEGKNLIQIEATAPDQITKNIYTITAFVPYEDCADLYDISVNGTSILDRMEDGQAILSVVEDYADLEVTALDKRAEISLTSGEDVFTGTGSMSQRINLYREAPEARLKITAADGKTTSVTLLKFEKTAYLSDLSYEEGATVGYGSIRKDQASSGSEIRLTDGEGNVKTYEKGLGTHADSRITYSLEGTSFQGLQGAVGVDYAKYDSVYANIRFTILADGETVFESGVMNGTTPEKTFEIDLSGVSEITLVAEQDANNYDAHADWADMKLTGQFPEAPQIPEPTTYSQTIQPSANGTITSSLQGRIEEGASVTYTFTPDQGYEVKKAMVNGEEVALTGNTYTVEHVKEDLTVTAVFERKTVPTPKYTVTYTGGQGAFGTAPVGISAAAGTKFSLPANPFTKAGFRFAGWSDGKNIYGPGSVYTMPAQNVVFTAVWTEIPAQVQAPAQVEGVSVKKSAVSYITISWKGAAGAAGYEVQRADRGKKNWKTVTATGKKQVKNTKLSAGRAYSYRVRAYVLADGQRVYGPWSASLSAATKPKKPKLKIQVKKTSVRLTWQKKTGADKIEIWRKTGKGKFKRVKTLKGTRTAYQMKIKRGTAYTFRIRGRKNAGDGKKVYSSYSKKIKVSVRK